MADKPAECPKCTAQMILLQRIITPDGAVIEKWECISCGHPEVTKHYPDNYTEAK